MFTIDDLRRVVKALAANWGGWVPAEMDGDFSDVPFDELGFDSAIRFEIVAAILAELELAADSGDVLVEEKTAGRLISAVNALTGDR
jgi:acyl carrier protein